MLRHTTFCAVVVVIMAMGSTYAQGRRGGACERLWGSDAWGLCNAYCEAKDCDSESPNGSENSCTQLYNNFQEITGEIMPCENSAPTGSQLGTCPCNFNVVYWTTQPQILQTANAATCTWIESSGLLTLINLTVDSSSTQDVLTFVATDPVSISGGTCAYDASFSSGATIITTPGGELPVTSEQFPACVSDIGALHDAYVELCK